MDVARLGPTYVVHRAWEETVVSLGTTGQDSEREWAPPGIDTSVPHSARMYDWWIGGKDNFAVDREMGAMFVQAIPSIRTMAKANRAFMHRAVRYLAGDAGIRQFLDIGTGIPTRPNVHEIAQAIAPETRVVYVDNDPIVLTHARALLVSGEHGQTAYIDADLREPDKILTDASLLRTLDLSQPVGLLLIAILMLLRDEDDPWGTVRRLLDALPSGSYLTLNEGADTSEALNEAQEAYNNSGAVPYVLRSPEQIAGFFEGLELVEPGVVPVTQWRPEAAATGDIPQYGGVGRKS
jgi:S-adenosyl methyltransferase